jgi:hypothetical protein
VLRSVAFARSLGAAWVQFLYATPYPGTGLWNAACGESLVEVREPEAYDGLTPVMRTRHLSRRQVAWLGRFATVAANLGWHRLAETRAEPLLLLRRMRNFVCYFNGMGREDI